jgi:8-oxo-dGTP pyrophosphatase MutT (NUDIX family)
MYIQFPKEKYEVHVAGFVFFDKKLLIAKRASYKKYWANLWECGGGKIETFENIEEAVEREYKEEFGIAVVPIKFMGVVVGYNYEMKKNFILFRYLLKPLTQNIILSEEHTEYKLINKQDVDKYIFIPGLNESIKEIENGYWTS